MNFICGINPVLEALAAGTRHFERLLVVKGLRSRRLSEAIRRATRLGIPLRFEMRETLDRIAGGVPHQGLIAVVSAKPLLSLEGLLENASDPALLVALDGVEDPRNLGAVLRSVEAAGADGALLPERRSAGLSETVSRSSAGALEHVPVARVANLVQALETLKSKGIWVVGFDASGQERWNAVDYKRSVCLVLGGEGRGIRRLVREHCDHLVSIPQFGHVSSLNVSVAAGIALYEVVRQRGAVPSTVKPIPSRPLTEPRVVGPSSDDAEDDPGAAPVPATGTDDDDGETDLEVPEPASLPHIDIDGEEVAWGQGPTVLKPVHSRREGRPPAWRRKSAPRRTRGEAGQKEGGDGPRAAGGGKKDTDRRGRRRRRRKRRASGGSDRPEGSAEGQGRGTAEKASPGSPPGDDEKGGSNGAAASSRQRRRRRRR